MKKLFLLLMLCMCISCGHTLQKWPKKTRIVLTVSEMNGNSATLTTPHSGVKYYVASEGRELAETKLFYMWFQPADLPGEFHAKIYRAIPVNDTLAIRQANKAERYLKIE